MKYSAATLAAIAQIASAHYFFDSVVVDGTAGKSFEYIRDFTRETKYNPIKFSSNPAEDLRDSSTIDGDDIICNQGAFASAGNTDVLEVAAGGDVTVKVAVGATVQHPGPTLYYMSKAPADVQSYDGSGDWFKIGEEGVCNAGGDFTRDAWCNYDQDTLTTTIPTDTPDGEYLLRFEHIGIHRSHVNQPEHYVSCVQVKVTGGGSGSPGPTVKFPGAYKDTDEYANFSIYGGFKDFPIPGPAVWESGSSGAANESATNEGTTNESATDDTPSPVIETEEDSNCASMWGQCGGRGFSGATCCSAGTCTTVNPYYAQCI